MYTEYRIVITAVFSNAADRDAAAAAMRTQIANYATNNPGKIKQAHVTKDDYSVPERTVDQVV